MIVMVNHVFITFSAVQIYDLSYIHLQKRRFSESWHSNLDSTAINERKPLHLAYLPLIRFKIKKMTELRDNTRRHIGREHVLLYYVAQSATRTLTTTNGLVARVE